MKAIFLVFINLKEMFQKAFFHQMIWIYFLQISNSLYRLLKTAVFVMMKISKKDRSIIFFCRASLIKTNKRRFSALDYKIIRPFKIKNF
jgi:hypothetical protein